MNDRRPARIRPGAVIVILLALAFSSSSHAEEPDARAESVAQLDDFFFTVEAVEPPADPAGTRPSCDGRGRTSCRPEGREPGVRVPFKFSGDCMAFVDLTGQKPVARPSSERLPSGELTSPILHVLRAGESATYEYLFTIPPIRPTCA